MRTCKHCGLDTNSSDDVARAQGWRWYDGPTLGGGRLVDVACPACAGYAERSATPEWAVGCNTCEWEHESEPGYDDEKVTNGRDALDLAHDHQCEAEMWIRPPGSDRSYPLSAFDGRTGKLRRTPARVGAA